MTYIREPSVHIEEIYRVRFTKTVESADVDLNYVKNHLKKTVDKLGIGNIESIEMIGYSELSVWIKCPRLLHYGLVDWIVKYMEQWLGIDFSDYTEVVEEPK